MQKIAVLGAPGGREAALARALQEDPDVSEIGIFGSNPGMKSLSKVRFFDQITKLDPSTFVDLGKFLKGEGYGGGVVGGELLLCNGIVDAWKQAGIDLPIFGPSQEAAKLESSKSHARQFMGEFNIPSPDNQTFDASQYNEALDFMRSLAARGVKIVLKADGLAGGKGVEIHDTVANASGELREYFNGNGGQGRYGEAGKTVVIEECIEGLEFSVFVLVDGTGTYKILPTAQDHKRLLDGDKGLNTGGMGAVSRFIHPNVDHAEMMRQVEKTIIQPTVDGIQSRGLDYKGVIYFGLMQTKDGPMVIEYNVRFGDPEAEVLLPLINTPFSQIVTAVTQGKLDELNLDVSSDFITGVVLAAEGYPVSPKKGAQIFGLEEAMKMPGVYVFHAGTAENPDRKIIVNGGRVLVVTGRGKTLKESTEVAYKGANAISFDGMQVRRDIAHHLLSK